MASKDARPVLFFDIDNTLYSKSTGTQNSMSFGALIYVIGTKIQDMMGELIGIARSHTAFTAY